MRDWIGCPCQASSGDAGSWSFCDGQLGSVGQLLREGRVEAWWYYERCGCKNGSSLRPGSSLYIRSWVVLSIYILVGSYDPSKSISAVLYDVVTKLKRVHGPARASVPRLRNPSGAFPAFDRWERAHPPRMVLAVADAALVGSWVSVTVSEFLISVLAFGQETSEFGPNVDVLQEGAFGVNVEGRAEAVAFGHDVKTDDPHGFDEAG